MLGDEWLASWPDRVVVSHGCWSAMAGEKAYVPERKAKKLGEDGHEHCGQCSASVNDDDLYCHNCGAEFDETETGS